MEFKLEVVVVPVSDVDRAKAFYADQVGFHGRRRRLAATSTSGSSR